MVNPTPLPGVRIERRFDDERQYEIERLRLALKTIANREPEIDRMRLETAFRTLREVTAEARAALAETR